MLLISDVLGPPAVRRVLQSVHKNQKKNEPFADMLNTEYFWPSFLSLEDQGRKSLYQIFQPELSASAVDEKMNQIFERLHGYGVWDVGWSDRPSYSGRSFSLVDVLEFPNEFAIRFNGHFNGGVDDLYQINPRTQRPGSKKCGFRRRAADPETRQYGLNEIRLANQLLKGYFYNRFPKTFDMRYNLKELWAV